MAGSDLLPVAGSKLYIGGVLATKAADFVAADFSGQTWTLVDGWAQAGSLGDDSNIISTDLINRGRTVKQKGTANAPDMQNVFAIVPGDAGQAALIAASRSNNNYAFKIEWMGATGIPVTISIATPGVVTDTAHGLVVGSPVVFSTTGALPTGLTAGTTYYVKTVADANSYTVAATPGGSAIATSGTQSGTHTRSGGTQTLFVGLVKNANRTGGNANAIRNLEATIAINSNQVDIP